MRDSKKAVPDVILMASGSEVELIYKAYDELEKCGIDARVVSIPSFELFDAQTDAYKEAILPAAVEKRFAVEAACSFGWHKYTGLKGQILALDHFGASGPASTVFEEFGFTVANVVSIVKSMMEA